MPMNQQNTATLEDIQSFPLETGRIMDVNSSDARQFVKDEAVEKTMHGNLVYDMVEEEHGDELLPDYEVYEAARRIDEERWFYRGTKRAFDIVFSAAILILFCWLYAIIAIIVKVDDPKGPVVFKQERVGKNGDRFMMWKFRSMRVNAEAQLDDLVMLNEKTGPVFKISRDPRITRAGRWLRKLSLASVIIGTPGDGESTKSLSRSANSSLDLQLCERRPGLCCIAGFIITYLSFLSLAFFGGQVSALKRRLQAFDVVSDGRVCAVAQMACAAVPLAEDWTVAA